jgi:hypothetical protein
LALSGHRRTEEIHMLAPGDYLLVPAPENPSCGPPHPASGEDRRPAPEPPRPELPDDRPETFLEALRRMLASIHT